MRIKVKVLIIAGLCCVVTVITAATSINKPTDDLYTNLQVLPKDISKKDLQKIMVDDFEDALGVSCSFCHTQKNEVGDLDFASDAKPEKQIARQMLRMTLNLNRDYFKIETPVMGATGNVAVTCNTCHRGDTFPEEGGGVKN